MRRHLKGMRDEAKGTAVVMGLRGGQVPTLGHRAPYNWHPDTL